MQYQNYKNNLQQIASKIGDVEQEAEEHKYGMINIHKFLQIASDFPFHRLVLETLEPMPQDRKCFRMINGVLVERKVSDVVPALKTNSDGLKKVLEDLLKQYKTLQDEMDKWKVPSAMNILDYIFATDLAYRRRTMSKLSNNNILTLARYSRTDPL